MGTSQSSPAIRPGAVDQHLKNVSASLNQAASGVRQMAVTADHAQDSVVRMRNAYKLFQAHIDKNVLKKGGYFGGDESYEPLADIKSYDTSLAAETKENLVRGLARALKEADLPIDPDAEMETIVQQLQKHVPNPQDKNGNFRKNAETHSKVCKIIANILNKEFTPDSENKLIDDSAGPESVCRQVAEYVHSLSTGIHTEFLAVHSSIKRVMKNIKDLDEVMRSLYERTIDGLIHDVPTDTSRKIEPFEDAYRRLRTERQRQIQLLENFLQVTLAPAKEELAQIMERENDSYHLINRLRLVPGSKDFGTALVATLTGLSTAAAVATRAHKSLLDVGLSVNQYLQNSDWKEFDALLDERRFSGEIKNEDIERFEKAAATLHETFQTKDEIAEELRKTTQGGEEGKTALDRRLEQRHSNRKLLLKQFLEKSTQEYNKLLESVKIIGPKLGREIPLSDSLKALRDALSRVNDMGTVALDLSLIGFYTTAAARQQRETFLAQMRVVKTSLDGLMQEAMYQNSAKYFAMMQEAIDSLLRVVDYYTDIVQKKYGGGVGRDQDSDVKCGGASLTSEEMGLADIARSQFDLREAVNGFLYFYYVAKVGENLQQTKEELSVYGKDYSDVLGDAIAGRLSALDIEKASILSRPTNEGGIGPEPIDDPEKRTWKSAKAAIETEYVTKKQFYRALSALDLYLKAFTDAVVSNPEDIKDIRRSLDGVQIIGRWFTEQTGDDLAELFEMMPTTGGDTSQVFSSTAPPGHYYEKVRAALEAGGGIGTTREPGYTDGNALRRQVGKVLSNFQALKNIVNAFTRIGDKFGGRELRRQVFMNPSQIYRVLLDYIQTSAVSVETRTARTYLTSVSRKLGGTWLTEDAFFVFMIKSMAAKILTVVGVFDLFQRPEPVYNLTPTRTIIGGDSYDLEPEVIEEAAELYFRLLRLAEFYRSLFAFKGDAVKEIQISMLPEMEGVFSGLIQQIFLQSSATVENGDYSTSEIRQLVREINGIYEHFKERSQGDAVSKALSSFVMEINRRYGLVRKREWDKFQKIVYETRNLQQFGDLNTTNYSILPGEEELEPERLAPSDRFTTATFTENFKYRPGLYNIDNPDENESTWMMVRNFRSKLDEIFSGPGVQEQFGKVAYGELIRQAQAEIRRAPSRTEKLQVAARLMQGAQVVGSDSDKGFLFHETVVTGLNILSGIYTMLDSFRTQVQAMDLTVMRGHVKEYIQHHPNTGNNKEGLVKFIKDKMGQKFSTKMGGYVRDGGAGVPGTRLAEIWGNAPVSANVTMQTLYTFLTNRFDDKTGEVASRYLIDHHQIMQDLIVSLFELTTESQNLVKLRFPGTDTSVQIQLDFADMKSLIESLMADVRYFMDVFRPHLPESVIRRYEQKGSGSSENVGSLYWLEDKLMDGLLKRTTRSSDSDAGLSLEDVSQKTSQIFMGLIQKWDIALEIRDGGQAHVPAMAVIENEDIPAPYRTEQYGRVFSHLIHYDAVQANSGLTAPSENVNTASYPLAPLIRTSPERAGGDLRQVELGGGAPPRMLSLYAGRGVNANRGLMMTFNQLLADYISRFYDAPTGKIYMNLINAFANGTFAQSVMQKAYAHPDLNGGMAFGSRADPTRRSVLLLSLALVLQRLMKDTNAQGNSLHLLSTLAEIPLYIKEAYRANLPVFVKQFNLLNGKGELLKQLLQRTSVEIGRPDLAGLANVPGEMVIAGIANGRSVPVDPAGSANGEPVGYFARGITFADTGLGELEQNSNERLRPRFVEIIDGITGGCYALSNAANEVLLELADDPLYLQTEENSIENYRKRYSKNPLMPFSLALTYLNDVQDTNNTSVSGPALSESPINDVRIVGDQVMGTPEFKMLYGNRKLLSQSTQIGLNDMPGERTILDNYNSTATERGKIDNQRFEGFIGRSVQGLRFLVDVRSYCAGLTYSGGTFAAISLVHKSGALESGKAIVTTGAKANAVYALRKTMTEVLNVVESSYQEEQIRNISNLVGTSEAEIGTSREKERIFNIIDMNIVPVNVHALMRSVPLINIYNYVYTFDQMVCLLYGENLDRIDDINLDSGLDGEYAPRNTQESFLKLMTDPYADVSMQIYGNDSTIRGTAGFVARIFRGDNALGMSRPKFLSDQLFNKALFGSLYPSIYEYDEGGAGVSAAVLRGRQNWGDPSYSAHPGLKDMSDALHGLSSYNDILGNVLARAAAVNGPEEITNNGNNTLTQAEVRTFYESLRRLIATFSNEVNKFMTNQAAAVVLQIPFSTEFNSLQAKIGDVMTILGTVTTINAESVAQRFDSNVQINMAVQPVDTLDKAAAFVTVYTIPSIQKTMQYAVGLGRRVLDNLSSQLYKSIGGTWTGPGTINTSDPPTKQKPSKAPDGGLSTTLTYIDPTAGDEENPWSFIKQAGMGKWKPHLQNMGKDRFDTRLVRNLFAITNIHRVIRLKLNKGLTEPRSVLMNSNSATDPSVTEYGPAENYTTTSYNSDARFL